MGVSGSAPLTPAVPRNKHLAHVSDPRSPSAGIPRTPIEVLSSPVGSPQPGPAEPLASTGQDPDPRSPTPGISRMPMRAAWRDSVDRLVKQLSEAFGSDAAPQEPSSPAEEPAAEAPAPRSSPLERAPGVAPALEEEAEKPRSPSAARPARPTGPGFSSGSKPVKRRTNTKVMAASGGTGRSPLSILQDENSPSAPAPRQGKRHMLEENLGEKKEVNMDLSRSLKSGNCTWSDLNKENQRCPFVEN